MAITAEDYDAATARMRQELEATSTIERVSYDEKDKLLSVFLRSGRRIRLQRDAIQILAGVSSTKIRSVVVTAAGTALYFPDLDEGLSLRGILSGKLGTDRWMRDHTKVSR